MAAISSVTVSAPSSTITVSWTNNARSASGAGCVTLRYYEVRRRKYYNGGSWNLIYLSAGSVGNISSYVTTAPGPGTWEYQVSAYDVPYVNEGSGCVPQGADNHASGSNYATAPGPDADPSPVPAFGSVTTSSYGSTQTSASQTISNITSGISVRVIGGEHNIAGAGWASAEGQINSGQTLQLRGVAPAAGGSTRVVQVILGEQTSYYFYIHTPVATSLISLPGSGTLSMKDIAEVFGPDPTNWTVDYAGAGPTLGIASYVRGGARVLDEAQNAGIPTAVPIDFADFYGAGAYMGFLNAPDMANFSVYPTNLRLEWPINSYRYGSPVVEFRSQVTLSGHTGANTGSKSLSYTADSGWTRNYHVAQIDYGWNGQRGDSIAWGTHTMSIRSLRGATVKSQTVNWFAELLDTL